jgi:hypothetical protein
MKPARVVKLSTVLALAGLLAGIAAPAAVARPKPPPVIEAPPMPEPPPMPSVELGSRFIDEAAAYDSYMREAAAISPGFTDAANVAASLRTGVAYDAGQLRRGAVAYAAIAALTDPVFVASVRRLGATPEQRYAIVAGIFESPIRALDFADGTRAAGLAKQALASAGMRLFDNGNAVKMAAYSIQHQPWSLVDVADRDARLSAMKRLSVSPRIPSDADTAALEGLVRGDASTIDPEGPAPGPYSLLVVRAVALAALAAVGEAGDEAHPRLTWLTDDYYLDHCLAEAKLSLYECLAVAKPNYEDVFCLGQHALKDTGACVVKASGGVVPIEIETTPLKLPSAHIRHGAVKRRRT